MCYYTITLDNCDSEGHIRALMITDAKNKEEAGNRFLLTYGSKYTDKLNINEGILIDHGFNELLTDVAKKALVRIKTNNNAPSDFLYSNQLCLKYSD